MNSKITVTFMAIERQKHQWNTALTKAFWSEYCYLTKIKKIMQNFVSVSQLWRLNIFYNILFPLGFSQC